MAYSKTPAISTYTTKTIKLLNTWESRDINANKDNETLNCFFEMVLDKTTGDSDHYVVKRDGTSAYAFTVPTSNIRGMHYWEDQNKLFISYDDDIAVVTASTGVLVTTLSNVFTTTSGDVGFTEFYYDNTTTKIVVTDGTKLATIDTANVFTASADVDLPAPHQPYPVFLDGYIFISKTNTTDIYNSDLNDPLAWTVGNFISAEREADKISRIAKLNNYIVAFGTSSIEIFWDAANASGSPLDSYQTPIKYVGFLGGLTRHGNKIYFVGNETNSGPSVFVMDDLKVSEINDPVLRRYLVDKTSFKGSMFSSGGHDFYVLVTGTLTYVFDPELKKWYRWAYKAQTDFPVQDATIISHSTLGNVSLFYISGSASLLLNNPTVFQDSGTNFTCRVVTDNEMFDTLNRKTVAKLTVHADRPTSSANLSISVSDDDFQTFGTARTVDLNQSWPMLPRWGQFRRRAHKLEFTANTPLRLYELELEVNMGQS